MRLHPVLPLLVAVALWACDDGHGPSADGTLVVSTLTGGEDPDPDGYLLTVDDLDTLELQPSGSAEIGVGPGTHGVRLLGVAAHCSVAPGHSLEVDVAPGSTIPVSFTVDCPATGVRVTTVTEGLDLDLDGYRITVNTVDRGGVGANGTALIRADPGERTIAVTDLARNCAIDGSPSRTVTIVAGEVESLQFSAVCTATSGVIRVAVDAEGVDIEGDYAATVDGVRHSVHRSRPTYLTRVPPGDHIVALLAPSNCSPRTEPQSVTLSAGGLVRDTAEVSFSVFCVDRLPGLRITAQTSGTPSPSDYTVWVCEVGFYCHFYPYLLGMLDPNGTLVVEVQPGSYEIWLDDVPSTCAVAGPRMFSIEQGEGLDLEYRVSCP